jgi:hypothetical protein
METRNKVPLALLADSISFKQIIKASTSEINKDLLLMDDSPGKFRKTSFEIEMKRSKHSKVPGRKKMRITEDFAPVLGLASLMNEIAELPILNVQDIVQEEKSEKVLKVKKTKGKKGKKSLITLPRAATHLSIANLIKEKTDRKPCK